MCQALLTARPPTRRHAITARRSACRTGEVSESLRRRTHKLLQTEIDFIPNRSFLTADADAKIPAEDQATCPEASRDSRLPRDLPVHLARLCQSKLLSAEEETRLFRRMNFLRFKANAIRSSFDPDDPDAEAIERVERFLSEAQAIRDRIVQSNMRLVMSVVRKFVTPQHSFDDMLSEGIYSLMQAADKFDYDRGFRFGTYAYRVIARNAFNKIKDGQKEVARFSVNAKEAVLDAPDERESSSSQNATWERLRGLLAKFMDRLDRREQLIIRSRYALGARRKVRTFQRLADKLGVSKERVRQLEQRAVAKLQSFAVEHSHEGHVGPVNAVVA
jgi:RNA polymerase primary sigma factor